MDVLDNKELLTRVDNADWDLEIGALTEVVAFSESPRALLFDSIKGYPKEYRVASDLYVSQRLQAIALGLPEDVSGLELVKIWRNRMRELTLLPPKEVGDGPVKENVVEGRDVDILRFPVPIWHEGDGGRYFGTGDVVVTRDPDEDWVNLGVYRCQVHDGKTLGMNIVGAHHGGVMASKYWAKGKDVPIAIVTGLDPYVYAGGCMPLPWGQSELDWAGGLRGSPIEVIIDGETGLPIPAHAEIAVIGHMPKGEERLEGPLGECYGYSTPAVPRPVIKIDKIWHRNDPILQGNPPMHGSAMMHALGAHLVTSAGIWDAIEKEVINVTGVYSLYQPCQSGSQIMVVALKTAFPGHSRQAALVALGSRAGVLSNKAVITVDEDVDPSSWDEVMFAVTSRCDPAEDIDIIRGMPSSPINPVLAAFPEKIAKKDYTTSTLIIDACRPYELKDRFPKVNIVSRELKEKMISKWGKKLGLVSK